MLTGRVRPSPFRLLALVGTALLACSKHERPLERPAEPHPAAPAASDPAALAAGASSPVDGEPRKFDVTFDSGGLRLRGWVVGAGGGGRVR